MFDFSKQNRTSPEVYHSTDSQVCLNKIDIENLKGLAVPNARERVRLCSHHTAEELVHEMFIIHRKNTYVRPHKHLNKIESMMVLQGEVDYVTFDDQGCITGKISMGEFSSGKIFYNRLDIQSYHMLIMKSDFVVFHEVTNGPFNINKTIYPDWAPIFFDKNFYSKKIKKFNTL